MQRGISSVSAVCLLFFSGTHMSQFMWFIPKLVESPRKSPSFPHDAVHEIFLRSVSGPTPLRRPFHRKWPYGNPNPRWIKGKGSRSFTDFWKWWSWINWFGPKLSFGGYLVTGKSGGIRVLRVPKRGGEWIRFLVNCVGGRKGSNPKKWFEEYTP